MKELPKRFTQNPGTQFSNCNECDLYLGYGKCEKYPDKIPRELSLKSYVKDDYSYCKYRKETERP